MKSIKMVPISDYVTLKMEVDRLTDLVEELTGKLARINLTSHAPLEKGIVVSSGGNSRYIKISDIVMFKAESNYSTIHLIDGSHLFTSKTVKYWTEKCNANFLYRVHKSYLVNARMIESFEASTATIHLKGGHKATYSETGRQLLSGLK
jgi:DNA-binding LytR/AlgR family response regulator